MRLRLGLTGFPWLEPGGLNWHFLCVTLWVLEIDNLLNFLLLDSRGSAGGLGRFYGLNFFTHLVEITQSDTLLESKCSSNDG